MATATAQQCHALTSYYITKYTGVIGQAPLVNRNKSRWGFEAILTDYTSGQVRELIDFYFDHYTDTPSIDGFLFNYEKVDEAKQDHEKEQVSRAKRLEETKRRAEQWRNRWQPQK